MMLVVHYAYMGKSGEPTWRLVLLAAQRLDAVAGEFSLQDLVAEVQRMDASRGRGSIQPVVQGMTANAGHGPASPCGKPLVRTGHGIYMIDAGTLPVPGDADGTRRAPNLNRPLGRGAKRGARWPTALQR